MNKTITTTTMTQPKPGMGMSRKAKQRRNRKSQTQKSVVTRVTTQTNAPRRRRQNRNHLSKNRVSDWLQSLKEPRNKGYKIPDPFTLVSTGTTQCEADIVLTIGDKGLAGVIIDPISLTYYATTNDSTYDDFNWYTGNPADYQPKFLDDRAANLRDALFSEWRVVSGSIDAVYTGNTSEDKGVAYGFCASPRQVGASVKQNFTNRYLPSGFFQLDDYVGTDQFPLRNGMRVLYYPNNTISATGFSNPTRQAGFTGVAFPLLGYFVNQATPGVNINIKVIVNLEGLAKFDDANVAENSPVNTFDWQRAWNWINDTKDKVIPLFGGWSGAANAAAQIAGSYLMNANTRSMSQLRLT
jgi:hypothetical protein